MCTRPRAVISWDSLRSQEYATSTTSRIKFIMLLMYFISLPSLSVDAMVFNLHLMQLTTSLHPTRCIHQTFGDISLMAWNSDSVIYTENKNRDYSTWKLIQCIRMTNRVSFRTSLSIRVNLMNTREYNQWHSIYVFFLFYFRNKTHAIGFYLQGFFSTSIFFN